MLLIWRMSVGCVFVCNSAIYYMGMLYLHNDICLTDIRGLDQLKFS